MGKGSKVIVEWTMSDRKLTAADIDHIETILAGLIAKEIIDQRNTAQEDQNQESVGDL